MELRDRRNASRIVVPEQPSFYAQIHSPFSSPGRVVDISNSGCAILIARPEMSTPDMSIEPGPLGFQLQLNDAVVFTISAEILYVLDQKKFWRLGIRFVELDPKLPSNLTQFLLEYHLRRPDSFVMPLPSQFTVMIAPDLIRATFLEYCLIKNRPITLYTQTHQRLSAWLQGITIRRQGDLDCLICQRKNETSGDSLPPAPKYLLTFAGENCLLFFESGLLPGNTETEIAIPLPSHLNQTKTRSGPRISAPQSMTIQVHHPRFPQQEITRSIMDIATNGLAFPLKILQDMIILGDVFSKMHINLDDRVLVCTGVVRNIFQRKDTKEYVCGVELLFDSMDDESYWKSLILNSLES